MIFLIIHLVQICLSLSSKSKFQSHKRPIQQASFVRSTHINPTIQERFDNLSSWLVLQYREAGLASILPCQSLRSSFPARNCRVGKLKKRADCFT